MAKITIHDAAKAALQELGWTENTASRSTKYTEMTKSGETRKIYLGASGSVRTGRTVASAFPLHVSNKDALIKRGKEILGG